MNTATKPQPVLIFMSVLTGLSVLVGGAALGDIVDPKVIGIAVLALAAVNQGVGYYLRGQVVPIGDVGAYLNRDRDMVAGPAAAVQDSKPVNIHPTIDGDVGWAGEEAEQ